MILTDYLKSTPDLTWEIARQCGVKHAVIRLPEDGGFDYADKSHWAQLCKRYTDYGFKPLIVEPMPNELHDHIKAGDEKRDESIEKVISMLPRMQEMGIESVCFNWMAHIGWLRTRSDYPERGGATVTGFDAVDFIPTDKKITADKLWDNYEYFLRATLPYAEKHGITLALHPDDPPLPRLGDVERIMISRDNIRKAIYGVCPSPALGLTMCQANFHIMGEDVKSVIQEFKDKIKFIHFRNTRGIPTSFRETFHDNGDMDMAGLMKEYLRCGINVPVRVDHVPTMAGESSEMAGYDALGRLFAIGYLKGILDATEGR